jgi:hypothetical protein
MPYGLGDDMQDMGNELAVLRKFKRSYDAAVKAELFEDGCAADLHDAGVKSLTDAYMRGRQDVLAEIIIGAH